MEKPNWYQKWENKTGTSLLHWLLFIFFSVSITGLMTENIGGNLSNSNLASVSSIEILSVKNNPSQPIPDQYIIEFNENNGSIPPGLAKKIILEANGRGLYEYNTVFKGFSAKLPEQALDKLRRNPFIKNIEKDQTVSITTSGVQTGLPSWGLDRIDQRTLPMDGQYAYQNIASNVYAYIIDTGIDMTHLEFQGRATSGYDFVDNDADASDCNGHGTHVAGTVGGQTVGIAKGVRLVAVRALDCAGSGTWSAVIAAIDWVATNGIRPAVINMSIGGGISSSVNTAVANATSKGVNVVVAAGNSGSDACQISPASAPSAITVAASDSGDNQAGFSNNGPCVDVYAPGVGITSSTMGGGYASWSGTSMASPHVAGVVALYLAGTPTATPTQIAYALSQDATQGAILGASAGTPNKLLFSMNTLQVQTPPPDTTAPTTPTNLSATSPDSSKANLVWSLSTDNVSVAGYKIIRNGIQIATASSGSYADTNVSVDTAYTYTVRAFDSAGNVSGDSDQVTITILPADFAINSYTVTSKTATTATITWTTNYPGGGSVTYNKSGSAPKTVTSTLSNVTNNQVVISGLTRNTNYNFTINATQTNTTKTAAASGIFRTKPK